LDSLKKYIAELIGTFALVLIGCGSAVIAGQYIGFLGISFAFGLTVLAMVYAIGNISGCHINPAITIAMLVAGKIKSKDAVVYIIAQCIGAIIAAGVILIIASGQADYSLSVNGLGQNGFGILSPGGYTLLACFVAEVVLTGLFLMVIFGSTSKEAPKGFAGISIGFSLVLIHLIGIPITGTSVNPARSLGPAIFVGGETLSQVWLFWIAPIIGGVIAAIIWKFIFDKK
jgi:aquaporin Z